MNERRFTGKIQRLHSPERVKMLEVDRVVDLCVKDMASVMDIGTGGGLFARAFAERGLKVTGVDVNPEILEAAREYAPDCEFLEAPAENLPGVDNAYDLAFMAHVLHEVDDYVKALREARRIARQRVGVLEWPYKEQESGPPLAHRLKHDDIVAYAEQAGFTKIERHDLDYMVLYCLEG